jgi:Glycosyl transferases group 1
MKALVISPGAPWSTIDVDAGLRYGLARHGVDVVQYRLTERIVGSRRWLSQAWQRARKVNPAIRKPTVADVFYQAGECAIAQALRHDVDVVVIVSAMFLHPDILILLKRAGLRVVVLFTESPYDIPHERRVAALVDGGWTTERTCVEDFRAVNRAFGYAPHGWHPERHRPGPQPGDDAVRAHDVVFVGSGFPERVKWLAAMDWRGIDLGLYGQWRLDARMSPLVPFIRGGVTDAATTTALYRRAKVGLNLYRASPTAESLNPRAYELAACGVPHLSSPRREVADVFGDLVPQVATPGEAEAVIRRWLAAPAERAAIAAALPGTVATASWPDRVPPLLADMQWLTTAA